MTIGRIGGVIERECGLEMILASPRDLPPPTACFDEGGDLEQYLDAAGVAVPASFFGDVFGDVGAIFFDGKDLCQSASQ